MAGQAVTFTEIQSMLDHFPDQPHPACGDCGKQKTAFEKALSHVKAWQVNDDQRVKISRPRVCLFAGAHGVLDNSTQGTRAWLESSALGKATVNQLCQLADAELRIYELDIDTPTADMTKQDAMEQEDAARAITYGMMAIEPGLDLVILGSVGAGVEVAAQAISTALGKNKPTDDRVKQALLHHDIQSIQNPLEVLRRLGGYDLCAMIGTAIAARMAGIPIFIDSTAGQAVKNILDAMAPAAGDHLYFVDAQIFGGQTHSAVAILPSLKANLILGQDKYCHSATQGACATRQAI